MNEIKLDPETETEFDRQLALTPEEFEQEVWEKHAARVRRGYSWE